MLVSRDCVDRVFGLSAPSRRILRCPNTALPGEEPLVDARDERGHRLVGRIPQLVVPGHVPVDVVPEDHRGRFSGIKAVFEVPLPLILVSFTIGKLVSKGYMWAGLLAALGTLTIVMLLTMLVREEPLKVLVGPAGLEPATRPL